MWCGAKQFCFITFQNVKWNWIELNWARLMRCVHTFMYTRKHTNIYIYNYETKCLYISVHNLCGMPTNQFRFNACSPVDESPSNAYTHTNFNSIHDWTRDETETNICRCALSLSFPFICLVRSNIYLNSSVFYFIPFWILMEFCI